MNFNGIFSNILYQSASGLIAGTLISYFFETTVPKPQGLFAEASETMGQLGLSGIAAIMNQDFSQRWGLDSAYPTNIVFQLALLGAQPKLTVKLHRLSELATTKLLHFANKVDGLETDVKGTHTVYPYNNTPEQEAVLPADNIE